MVYNIATQILSTKWLNYSSCGCKLVAGHGQDKGSSSGY